MFKTLYRAKQEHLETLNKNEYDKSIDKLFKGQRNIEVLCILIYVCMFIITVLLLYIPLQKRSDILSTISMIIIGIVFLKIYFKVTDNYIWRLTIDGTIISNFLFFHIYTVKGKAIAHNDYKKIKKYDKSLYRFIKTKRCTGYCYQVCFYLLKALKKGSIRFVAIKVREVEKIKNEFTMHVIYVNEGWCFDTFTRKQYKVEELMNFYKAKEFKSFSYNDVAEKSYEEFREDNYSEMKIWCKENNCHQSVV